MTLGARLSAAWAALRGGPLGGTGEATPAPFGRGGDGSGDAASVAVSAELASVRLALDEVKRDADGLRRSLDGERAARADAVASAVATRVDPVLGEAAGLLAQLALQDRLIADGKPVAARDVAALARGFSRLFERLGLVPLGMPGQVVAFDPASHQMMGGAAPAVGASVAIRMPGYKAGDRLLRKAVVDSSVAGPGAPAHAQG